MCQKLTNKRWRGNLIKIFVVPFGIAALFVLIGVAVDDDVINYVIKFTFLSFACLKLC